MLLQLLPDFATLQRWNEYGGTGDRISHESS
jgi:hypothetical protein